MLLSHNTCHDAENSSVMSISWYREISKKYFFVENEDKRNNTSKTKIVFSSQSINDIVSTIDNSVGSFICNTYLRQGWDLTPKSHFDK